MGRGPEERTNTGENQPEEPGVTPGEVMPATPQAGSFPIFVDGGRAWGPRPKLTPTEIGREDQNQARLIESIDLHRN